MASEGKKVSFENRIGAGWAMCHITANSPALGTEDSETPLPHFLGTFQHQHQHPQRAIGLALPHCHLAGPQLAPPGFQPQQEALGVRTGVTGVPAAPSNLPLRSALRRCLQLGWDCLLVPPMELGRGSGDPGIGMGRQRPLGDGTGAPRLCRAALSPAPNSG